MKKILLLSIAAVILFVSNVFAQIPAPAAPPAIFAPAKPVSAETKELVRTLLEANGMRTSMIRIFEDIISQAPAESQKDLRAVLKGGVIIDNMIPVYAKYFTSDELKELINFYKSPIGTKNLSLTPVLMTEVMQVSQKYFEDSIKSMPKPAADAMAPSPAKK